MTHNLARVGAVLVALVLTIATTAATRARLGIPSVRGFETPAEARAEYSARASARIFPPGTRSMAPGLLARRIASTGPDGAPMTFQPGFGAAVADREWLCLWARYQSAHGPSVAFASAMAARLRSADAIPDEERTQLGVMFASFAATAAAIEPLTQTCSDEAAG